MEGGGGEWGVVWREVSAALLEAGRRGWAGGAGDGRWAVKKSLLMLAALNTKEWLGEWAWARSQAQVLVVGAAFIRDETQPTKRNVFCRLNETFYWGSCGFRSVSLI